MKPVFLILISFIAFRLIGPTTSCAQGAQIRLMLRSQVHDTLDVKVQYSGKRNDSELWHYGAILIDSTLPGGSIAEIHRDTSMQCAMYDSHLNPLLEYATFRLDTISKMVRGLTITLNGSLILGYAVNNYTLDFGDIAITPSTPGHWSATPGDVTVHMQQDAYISHSLIGPGTMINGSGSDDRYIIDSGFSLSLAIAPLASVNAPESLQTFRYVEGTLFFSPASQNRNLKIYDLTGRTTAKIEVAAGTYQLSLPRLPATGMYIARLNSDAIKIVYRN